MMPDYIYNADLNDFEKKVVEASAQAPVMVDFWADWCSPCHAIAPHLVQVVNELEGEISLAKVEVDEGENMKLAGHYKLRGFPTIILFNQGVEVARFSGSRPARWIGDWLEQHLQPA